MFSFSSALWLAAASAVITADYDADQICESNGLKFRCAHEAICQDDAFTTLQCDWGDVINIHSVNFGKRDVNARLLKDTCQSTYAMQSLAEICNEMNSCDLHYFIVSSLGYACADSKCAEVFYFCGPLKKVCEKNSADLRCDAGESIRIQTAQYAKQDKSDCSSGHDQDKDCTTRKPLAKASEICDGKNSCTIRADAFVNRCKETEKSLILSYTCLEQSSSAQDRPLWLHKWLQNLS